MLDSPRENNRSRTQKRRWLHLPSWAKGLLVGEVVWVLALLGAMFFENIETRLPPLLRKLDVADSVGSACGIVAAPVPLGGWILIWGDNGPPYAWIESWEFNIAFGVCFYGLLGVLTERLWRSVFRRYSFRLLFAGVTVIAVLLGIWRWMTQSLGTP